MVFDPSSIYSNIFYVLKMMNNQNCPSNIRRSGPWIFWSIWKNRNSFLFQGRLSVGPIFSQFIYEEVKHWFLVKEFENQRILFGWKAPPDSWLKCDIASVWDKNRNEIELLGFLEIRMARFCFIEEELSPTCSANLTLMKTGIGELKICSPYTLIPLSFHVKIMVL